MSTQVRIRRCTLTVRRRDGWSWGAAAEPHVTAAMAALQTVVDEAIAKAGLDPAVEIFLDTPVALKIGRGGEPSAATRDALVEALRAAAHSASPTALDEGLLDAAESRSGRSGASTEAGWIGAALPGESPARGLARTLARWSRSGEIERVLDTWPSGLADDWIVAVESAAEEPGPGETSGVGAPMSTEAVGRVADAMLARRPAAAGLGDLGRDLLILLAALTTALGECIPDRATQALARRRVLGETGTGHGPPPPSVSLDPPPAPNLADWASTGETSTTARRQPAELVVPALPLLVLAQLSLIGYVDAIVATAAAARLPRAAGALGGAVAGKVLPAPWRDPSAGETQEAVVAVASGEPVESLADSLASVAAHEQALLAPLAGALAAAYAEGWSANVPLLVSAGPEGIVCGEEDGLFPAAWVESEAELAEVRRALGGPPLRLGDGFGPLARTLHERRSVPGAPALERHLGAAAGTALGLIARTLWGGDGRETSPLLALKRLGDLEALVRCEPDGVIAAIPRGQRWLDLQRGGLLELFTIPWLPGARLEIGTW
ncbi:MAG: hypothetical protein QOH12_2168 [Solirubrobacteraceae bacterium]|nr:hypothetical protein [Solirubrobacteraceae bacterium]